MFDAEALVRDLIPFHNVVCIGKYNAKVFFSYCELPEIASVEKARPVRVPVVAGKPARQKRECQGKRKVPGTRSACAEPRWGLVCSGPGGCHYTG